MTFLEDTIAVVTDIYWSVLFYLLIGTGIYFTIRTRAIQYRRFGRMLFSPRSFLSTGDGKHGVGSLYTFFTALGTMIGSGNIFGVSVAIFLGGPGAVFWMWLIATVNMSVSVVETTLGQYYKQKSTLEQDKYIGGPAYYILHGLGLRWMAILFAVAICMNMIVFNGLQSHFLAGYVHRGLEFNHLWTGIGLAALFIAVVFWGVRSIAKVASYMVPIGTGLYMCVAIYILITNYDKVPGAMYTIVSMGLGLEQAVGGLAGFAFANAARQGARRGLYSNEAGLGTIACIAAASNVKHPTQESFVQMFCIFIDTIVVCTCTALLIMTSGIDITVDPATSQFGSGGSLLIDKAIVTHLAHLGLGKLPTYVMMGIMSFLVFTSLIGNYYIGETNQRFFKDTNFMKRAYQMVHVFIIIAFAVQTAKLAINVTDLIMGIAASTNVIGILLLGNKSLKIIKDYENQLDSGIEIPVFKGEYPLLKK